MCCTAGPSAPTWDIIFCPGGFYSSDGGLTIFENMPKPPEMRTFHFIWMRFICHSDVGRRGSWAAVAHLRKAKFTFASNVSNTLDSPVWLASLAQISKCKLIWNVITSPRAIWYHFVNVSCFACPLFMYEMSRDGVLCYRPGALAIMLSLWSAFLLLSLGIIQSHSLQLHKTETADLCRKRWVRITLCVYFCIFGGGGGCACTLVSDITHIHVSPHPFTAELCLLAWLSQWMHSHRVWSSVLFKKAAYARG